MLDLLKDLAESLSIHPRAAFITILLLSILGAGIAFAYKENFFGFKNKVRKLFKAEPEDKLDRDAKGEGLEKNKDASDAVPAQAVVEQVWVSTPAVRFRNERVPKGLDIQRAVHEIIGSRSTDSYQIPLHYDARVGFLMQKLEGLYDQYEQRIEKEGGRGSPEDFSSLRRTIDNVRSALANLPRTLGLTVKRLSSERRELDDSSIAQICSRFVELRMTEILSAITRFQFDRDSPILVEYANLGSYQQYVAHMDGVPLSSLVSYRIWFVGDRDERIVYAPGMYGFRWLLVVNEFAVRGKGYIPPLSFMVKYVYPQMLLWFVEKPDEWSFEWKCNSVDAKDLDGNYLDQYSNQAPVDLDS